MADHEHSFAFLRHETKRYERWHNHYEHWHRDVFFCTGCLTHEYRPVEFGPGQGYDKLGGPWISTTSESL